MKILILADGRSPITKHWLDGLKQLGHTVIFVSSYPCERLDSMDEFHVLPIAFAGLAGSQTAKTNPASGVQSAAKPGSDWIKRFRPLFLWLRYWLGPLLLPYYGWRLNRIVKETRPDLVHALRIPFEGMTASFLPKNVPFAVSIWGNDLTFHAAGSGLMRRMTVRTLSRADGLAADTQRDIRLGKLWGFSEQGRTLVVPGNGGIDITEVRIASETGAAALNWLPLNRPLVVNPRGFRPGSVRNDTFFRSIPLILSQQPETFFVCCSMAEQPEALNWISRLQIEPHVLLLPVLPQETLWSIFRRARVTVTVSEHDGTPNSLLEAMTCGCFPVAGDIESMREWITPGINGMLVDPDSPEELATAVLDALQNEPLRIAAAAINLEKIREKAEISLIQTAIEVFYNQLTP